MIAMGALLATTLALAPNQLTPDQKKQGWRLLFDGSTTAGWRGFNTSGFPAVRWEVVDGTLHVRKATRDDHGGADIVTTDTFGDFDLVWEWRVAPGGNSGLKYFVAEERREPIAHEYQLLDDERHPDGRVGPHRQTAAFYDVLAPTADKPVSVGGDWNISRVVVTGNHVEHWFNGRKVLEYELGSPALQAAIAKSKFRDVAGFGTKIPGRILLQDHGDEAWFRSIRILAR